MLIGVKDDTPVAQTVGMDHQVFAAEGSGNLQGFLNESQIVLLLALVYQGKAPVAGKTGHPQVIPMAKFLDPQDILVHPGPELNVIKSRFLGQPEPLLKGRIREEHLDAQ
jgi:hypothetical protein